MNNVAASERPTIQFKLDGIIFTAYKLGQYFDPKTSMIWVNVQPVSYTVCGKEYVSGSDDTAFRVSADCLV